MHRVLKAFLEVTIKQRINNLPYYTIILQRALCDQIPCLAGRVYPLHKKFIWVFPSATGACSWQNKNG